MQLDRRTFLAAGSAAAAVGGAAPRRATARAAQPRGKAEHCIFLWLGGGACQVDTFDPKRMGDPKAKKPGSYYPAIPTAIEGVEVCEHLPRSAELMERIVPVRTVHHDVIDEHAAAVNRMHTGRPTSGTVVYPSVGSVVAHERGPAADGVPAYVLMGAPNVTRGPGFLGPEAGYIYLTDADSGPAAFRRPPGVGDARMARRREMLARMRSRYLRRAEIESRQTPRVYDQMIAEAERLSGPEFLDIFRLDREPDELREAYGSEFGQRCLLARRLVERGVRFIEVSHNLTFVNGAGWDTHNEGQLKQHLLVQQLDDALASLVSDLEEKRLLDKTLVVVATEFGRPAAFDGRGGRGHQSRCFSCVLAGGGLRTGQAIGVSDELGEKVADRPVSVPDFLATIYATLGIDPHEELYDPGDRPIPITDGGQPIAELF